MTFKEFTKQRWKEYIVPLVGPVVVFTLSAFVTNIGWMAIPACLVVTVIVTALKTFELYNRWYSVESMMTAIKAAGRVIRPGDEG